MNKQTTALQDLIDFATNKKYNSFGVEEIISKATELLNKEREQMANVEEKAFWACKCGIKTVVTDGKGFFTNDISVVNTIEEYRNHPHYQSYIIHPYPGESVITELKNKYFNQTSTL